MKRVAAVSAIFSGLCVLMLSQPSPGAEDQTRVVSPSDLTWRPVTTLPPGVEISIIQGPFDKKQPFMYRLRYQPGWTVPGHSHPGAYHLTVISGTFNLGLGSKFDKSKTRPLKAGTVVLVAAGQKHFAWVDDDQTVVQIDAVGPWITIWADPKDDPASKMTR
jgi:quercetin dioxygenase-like cupin family protein